MRGRILVLLSGLLFLTAAPLSAAEPTLQRSSANIRLPRIALQLLSWNNQGGQIVTIAADGRGGVHQLVPGMHNFGGCQSADGRKMVYTSDREAPHEQFVYVSDADGTHAVKITEAQVGYGCPFSERWLLLGKPAGGWGATTEIRHDLQTGAEKEIIPSVDRGSISPDGNKLLFVGGLDFTPVQRQVRPNGKETLEVLDLATLEERTLAGPIPPSQSYRFYCSRCIDSWSPDGKQVAYTLGPTTYIHRRPKRARAQQYAVYVQNVAGGTARQVLRYAGGPPSISWSADSKRLLVCAENRSFGGDQFGCDGGAERQKCTRKPTVHCRPIKGYFSPEFAGKLTLIDLAHHSAVRVAAGKLFFAQWAPSGDRYAFATTSAVYVGRPGGTRRVLAAATKPAWPDGGWMGWSPDGRYVGVGEFGRLAVLDVRTGRVRILLRDQKGKFVIWSSRWWR